jgi:hypothetical protein
LSRYARESRNGVGRINRSELGLTLNANYPVRSELIVAANLPSADNAAAAIAPVINERRRYAREPNLPGIETVPAGTDAAA